MGFLEKLLVAGGAAFIASAFREARQAQEETRRRRNSPLRFDERLSQSDFTALATEIAHRTPRVIGADVAGMTVVLDIRSISGLSSWQAEVDFNDYGRLTGNYWINTENEDSQIPEHFANALSARVAERTAAYQPRRDVGERDQPNEQARDRVSAGATQSAPPGWYPTAEGQRYWNGSAWIYEPARNDWSAHAGPLFPQAAGRPGTSPGAVVVAWIIAFLTLGYMLPWAVAMSRGTRNRASVGWVNLLLGWTVVGWIVALVMASAG